MSCNETIELDAAFEVEDDPKRSLEKKDSEAGGVGVGALDEGAEGVVVWEAGRDTIGLSVRARCGNGERRLGVVGWASVFRRESDPTEEESVSRLEFSGCSDTVGIVPESSVDDVMLDEGWPEDRLRRPSRSLHLLHPMSLPFELSAL